MSFDDENLHVTSHRQFACPGSGSYQSFLSYFSCGQLLWAARIARVLELALWPDGGFYVSVVTLLTSMKLIIALLVQEVKRYVVISLIPFCNGLISNDYLAFDRQK
ncbi:hypothetical protein [Duganella sp. P38]|uniref:hypothetical protein n=1 Tax=Duganella sp. P38 TaxID=3423949 RepID=UPI003D7A2167